MGFNLRLQKRVPFIIGILTCSLATSATIKLDVFACVLFEANPLVSFSLHVNLRLDCVYVYIE